MTSKALMKRSEEEMKSGEESSGDESASEPQQKAPKKQKTSGGNAEEGGRYEKLERLKREKRLAMNRECARARRRRKKLRLELLEGRVQEMTQKNSKIQETNDALRARVAQLEAELNMAKSTIAMLSSGSHGGGSAGSSMPSAAGAGGFMDSGRLPGSSSDNSAFLSEKFNLQRRAALAGLGGGPSAGFGGFPGAGGGAQDPSAALRYMQLMQAKNSLGNHQFGGAGGLPTGFGAEAMAGAGGADSYSGMY